MRCVCFSWELTLTLAVTYFCNSWIVCLWWWLVGSQRLPGSLESTLKSCLFSSYENDGLKAQIIEQTCHMQRGEMNKQTHLKKRKLKSSPSLQRSQVCFCHNIIIFPKYKLTNGDSHKATEEQPLLDPWVGARLLGALGQCPTVPLTLRTQGAIRVNFPALR